MARTPATAEQLAARATASSIVEFNPFFPIEASGNVRKRKASAKARQSYMRTYGAWVNGHMDFIKFFEGYEKLVISAQSEGRKLEKHEKPVFVVKVMALDVPVNLEMQFVPEFLVRWLLDNSLDMHFNGYSFTIKMIQEGV